jgi:hypothetical protein
MLIELIIAFFVMQGIVVPVGEDEGEELYAIVLEHRAYDYVTTEELYEWIDTGAIRNDEGNFYACHFCKNNESEE